MSQFYQHSGTVPIGGAIRTAIEGSAAATFMAIIYSYAINYIPFVYLNIALTLGFGAILGALVGHEAKATKIRHSLVPALIGFVCGMAGLYVAWAIDLKARGALPPGRGMLAGLDPAILLPYVSQFYENGAWGIGKGGGNVSGIPLAAVWLCEAGTIVGLATWIPWKDYQSNVFCESCDAWAGSIPNVLRLDASAADDVVAWLMAGDFAALETASRAEPGADSFLRVKLDSCESCDETNCLGVDHVTIQVDKEGKPKEKLKTLVNRMLISRRDAVFLHQMGEAVPEKTADEAEVGPAQSGEVAAGPLDENLEPA
jgi:hypothetical protein